jgi:hypothetical protein
LKVAVAEGGSGPICITGSCKFPLMLSGTATDIGRSCTHSEQQNASLTFPQVLESVRDGR